MSRIEVNLFDTMEQYISLHVSSSENFQLLPNIKLIFLFS